MNNNLKIPTFDELMQPAINALVSLGGSGSIVEIYEKVVLLEKLSDEVTAVLHNPEKSSQTAVSYRLAWARTYLKKAGYLDNSDRGVWALTDKAKKDNVIDAQAIVRYVRTLGKKGIGASTKIYSSEHEDLDSIDVPEEALEWREQLHQILIEQMTPDGFERLTQRLLRESGFVHVEVTGRTGDGGIDGRGIARVNGLMSFHVAFQCKKYKGAVSVSEIRDFRGATVGRADRGLFITTGGFTKSAIEEASRDGASPIDLVDGDQLVSKLKELSLGVKTEMIEEVTVDSEWFISL